MLADLAGKPFFRINNKITYSVARMISLSLDIDACAGDEEKQVTTPTKLRTARTARLLLRMAVILPMHWACAEAQSSRKRRPPATSA